MEVKAFEIRDKGTFIPAIGILMEPSRLDEDSHDVERWLLRRAGFEGFHRPMWPWDVILCRLEAKGTDRNATYDPYSWGDRTFQVAHRYICANWPELKSGAVVDVSFILKETEQPKTSERESDADRAEAH